MTRVLMADDHPMIQTAIQVLLEGSGFDLVETAASGAEAIEALKSTDADILLLDVRMPEGSGVDVLRKVREEGDEQRVVLLTAGMADSALFDALKLGVDGIVLKNADPGFLIECLETVRDGGTWIDPELKERVARLESESGRRAALAPRERDLVALVRKGLRNRDIAERLGVTEGTVKVYLHAIFEKTGVANRTELAMKADELIGAEPGTA